MAGVFFTSDLHFGHSKIVDFRGQVHNKEFQTVADVDEWIIDSWNSVVRKKDDLVWVLGDIAFTDEGLANFGKLNGRKKLILGNHDMFSIAQLSEHFDAVYGVHKKYDFVMSHVPIHPSCLEYRWFNNVHGHIHHKHYAINTDAHYVNVNIDVIGPYPAHIDQVRSWIDIKQ